MSHSFCDIKSRLLRIQVSDHGFSGLRHRGRPGFRMGARHKPCPACLFVLLSGHLADGRASAPADKTSFCRGFGVCTALSLGSHLRLFTDSPAVRVVVTSFCFGFRILLEEG